VGADSSKTAPGEVKLRDPGKLEFPGPPTEGDGMPKATEADTIPAPFVTTRTRALLGTRALDFLRDGRWASESLARVAGVPPSSIVRAQQVHGADVVTLDAPPLEPPRADALATRSRGLVLLALGADCPGVALLADEVAAVAVAHSGWRGTVADVAPRAVEPLVVWGARPREIDAWIGPGIGPCCFEVGDEVVAAFESAHGALGELVRKGPRGRPHVDLPRAIARRLVERAGLDPARVLVSGICTRCSPERLFSRRGEGPSCGHHGLAAWVA
jgi:YfiH family protein